MAKIRDQEKFKPPLFWAVPPSHVLFTGLYWMILGVVGSLIIALATAPSLFENNSGRIAVTIISTLVSLLISGWVLWPWLRIKRLEQGYTITTHGMIVSSDKSIFYTSFILEHSDGTREIFLTTSRIYKDSISELPQHIEIEYYPKTKRIVRLTVVG